MEEKEYLRAGNVLVTSSRIEINGQTFAVRNVGSVKVTKPGTPLFAALVLLIGLGMAINSESRIAGVVLLLGSAAWIWQKLTTRRLVLVSGGGETVALTSTNGGFIETTRAAIAEAISGR